MDGRSAELLEQMRQGLDRIEQANEDAQRRMARYANLEEEMAGIQASVSSPDRSVTVVAGPGGGIQQVRFTDQATRLTATQLSEVVTATIQQAVAAAARQQAATVQDFAGDNIRIADRVAKAQEALLGQSDTALADIHPPHRSIPGERDDDEGFGSVFGRETS